MPPVRPVPPRAGATVQDSPCPFHAVRLWFPGEHRTRADDAPRPPRPRAATPRAPEARGRGRPARRRGSAGDGLVLTGGYAAFAYASLSNNVTKIDAIAPKAKGADDVDGTAQNILLVGDDHRPDNATPEEMAELSTESDGGATNTDTMIVLHISADGSQATMISFPRDSYVDIPGVGKGKLNSAFYYGTLNGGGDTGGAKLLIQTIQDLSGLTIDHYVRVSLLGFYQVVKELGPVEVCLNQPAKDPYSGVACPRGRPSSTRSRRSPSCASATDCRTVTSTATSASSTSCRRRPARCCPPARCSTP